MLLPSYKQELEQKLEQERKTVNAFRLLIVGAAPYDSGATGIPFMKADWDAMENPSCSGLYVLQSITGKCIHELAEEQKALNRSPDAFASLLLRDAGVGFINASYSKRQKKEKIKIFRGKVKTAWTRVNQPIVERAAAVLLCGEAKEILKIPPGLTQCTAIVHPDLRNTMNRYADWKQWWYIGRLKSLYNIPDVPGRGNARTGVPGQAASPGR